MPRKISREDGEAALRIWRADAESASRTVRATAVRFTLQQLADAAPGHSVEVRVPPFGAVQCIDGPRHRRGTPPAVIETDAQTWLELATGGVTWGVAQESGRIRASGERAALADHLPLSALHAPGGE